MIRKFNLSTKTIFYFGLIINLICGNSFFMFFNIQAVYSWQQPGTIFLLGLMGIFSVLCSLIFYIVFYQLNYQRYPTFGLFLLSIFCCLAITFFGGIGVAIMTGIEGAKFSLEFSEIVIFMITCFVFGFFACLIFAMVVIPVGIINGFWFMAMKTARLREQSAMLNPIL